MITLHHRSTGWRYLTAALVGIACVVASSPTGIACDTPVYRYAMYRWKPQANEIYAIHKKPITGAAAKVRSAVNKLIDSKKNPANLAYISVDVSKDPDLKSVPEQVRLQYKRAKVEGDTAYLIFSPMGRHLFTGTLTAKDIVGIADSKGRKQLTAELAAGKTGVLVLLASSDKKANEVARTTIKQLQQSVKKGTISLRPRQDQRRQRKGQKEEGGHQPRKRIRRY